MNFNVEEARKQLDNEIMDALFDAFQEGCRSGGKAGIYNAKDSFVAIKTAFCKAIPPKYEIAQHDPVVITINNTIDDMHKLCGKYCTLKEEEAG